jgi:hypothetical protein
MALTVEQDRNRCKNAPNHTLGSFVTTSLVAFSLRFSVHALEKSCRQLQDRRIETTGYEFVGTRSGCSRTESDADGYRSFAAVERLSSDRRLDNIATEWYKAFVRRPHVVYSPRLNLCRIGILTLPARCSTAGYIRHRCPT